MGYQVNINVTDNLNNMATFTNQTKNTATYSNQAQSLVGSVTASAGLVMGLLLSLTYSGGQTLVAGTQPTWSNQNKN